MARTRQPRSLESFNPRLIDYMQEASSRPITLYFPTRGAAIQFRQEVYHFRKLLCEQPGHAWHGIARLARAELVISDPGDSGNEGPQRWFLNSYPRGEAPNTVALDEILTSAGIPNGVVPATQNPVSPAESLPQYLETEAPRPNIPYLSKE